MRDLRKTRGLTQKDLAERVDLDFTYLSKVETDRARPPREDKIRKLAHALGADAEELVFLAGKVPKGMHSTLAESAGVPAILRALADNELTDDDLKRFLASIRSRRGKTTK